ADRVHHARPKGGRGLFRWRPRDERSAIQGDCIRLRKSAVRMGEVINITGTGVRSTGPFQKPSTSELIDPVGSKLPVLCAPERLDFGMPNLSFRMAKNNRSKSVCTLFQRKHLSNQTVWPVIFGLTGPICARALKSLHRFELLPRGHHDWPVKPNTRSQQLTSTGEDLSASYIAGEDSVQEDYETSFVIRAGLPLMNTLGCSHGPTNYRDGPRSPVSLRAENAHGVYGSCAPRGQQ